MAHDEIVKVVGEAWVATEPVIMVSNKVQCIFVEINRFEMRLFEHGFALGEKGWKCH